MSNKGIITAYGRSVLLTIQTNAAYRQRVKIVGPPDINTTVEGAGERNIIWQAWVQAGAWSVEHWYLRPGGGWEPGVMRRFDLGQIGFDETGQNGDFNDALVTAVSVHRATLENAAAALEVHDRTSGNRPEFLEAPNDPGVSVS